MPCRTSIRARLVLGAAALALAALVPATPWDARDATSAALAEEGIAATGSSPVTTAETSELQQRVEETATAYDEAVVAREALEAQMAQTQARIDELEAQLPSLRESAAAAMRTAYKFHQGSLGLVQLLISADDFSSLISTIQYLSSIQEHGTNQIGELTSAVAELESSRQELAQAREEAKTREDEAAVALAQAQEARQDAQRRAEEQAAAQRAQEEAALAAQQAAASEQAQAQREAIAADAGAVAETTGNTSGSAGEATTSPNATTIPAESADASSDAAGTGVGWDSDKAAFVSSWGARIDAYLAGSALAGQGATFAAAAWDYGVDPRFSPAIAFVESTLGAQCFLPHNAWGWGSASWSSWEEAIYAHVSGLARIYGAGLTYEGACMYCPTNADFWYAAVLGQMESM